MKVAFICGSYRAKTVNGISENIQRAENYAKQYWKKGYAVICPHKNTAFFDGLCCDKVWLNGAKELLRRSDVIVLIPGWKSSMGSRSEHKLAIKLSKEIIEEM